MKFFFRRERHLSPDEPDTFRVESLKSAIQTFNNISIMVTLVAGGIVGISLLVGGVGIMNIMLVSISERTKEIGLRKAVGAKRSAILTQFLIEAIILCFVGGLVGVGWVGSDFCDSTFKSAAGENIYTGLGDSCCRLVSRGQWE